MILHTIVPIELVLKKTDDKKNVPQYEEIEYLGQKVEVAKYENELVINRVYSTSPKIYLNPEFLPGKSINMEKYNKNK